MFQALLDKWQYAGRAARDFSPDKAIFRSLCIAGKSNAVWREKIRRLGMLSIFQTRPGSLSSLKLHFGLEAGLLQGGAEEAGGLVPVKDDNAVMEQPGPGTTVMFWLDKIAGGKASPYPERKRL